MKVGELSYNFLKYHNLSIETSLQLCNSNKYKQERDKMNDTVNTATAITIESVEDSSKYLSALLYGYTGSGKTTLAASFVDTIKYRCLFIDIDQGALSLRNSPIVENSDKIDVVKVKTFDALEVIYQFLHQHAYLRDIKNGQGLKDLHYRTFGVQTPDGQACPVYEMVIVDSLSEVDRLSWYKASGFSGDSKDIFATMKYNKSKTLQFWGDHKRQLETLTRAFTGLDMHVIFTALANTKNLMRDPVAELRIKEQAGQKLAPNGHPAIEQDDDDSDKLLSASLSGSAANTVPASFDIVGYLFIDENGKRRLITKTSYGVVAKSRINGVEDFVNPTGLNIMKAAGLIKLKPKPKPNLKSETPKGN